ncbi:MAG TPA: methyl-accepting chemotaxis protein, partial [Steroidobacteraceae bacterium]
EIGELLRNLDGMQSQLRSQIGAERAAAAENVRIRQALDKVSRSVVLADRDQKIIYLNEAARRNFSETQPQIRRVIPGFDADSLQGASVDALAADPAGQHEMLASLSSSHSEERELGECTFQVVTNPVVDSSGARLGTVMEWTNRTQQVSVEREMKQMLAAVVGGDLSRRIDVAGKAGFFRDMSVGVNELANSLGQIVSKAKDVALGVHRGAEEISAGNVSLSQRTESQAASLEETASSMEQMTSTVKQNADNASEANQLASAARDLAERGGTVVANAVDAMGQISASSSKIADIISVIDEIAFQTNLLALNAAVEAARAGEQGRGFAVVATEVRSLASRSATAAKQIKELIEDSLKKVADGSALVIQSGSSLNEIVRAVKQVSDIVAEIAAASREQSSGIEQVNKAMMQMDESTQQNAALVEQATAASQALADQAQELKALMENYNVSSQGQQWSARASVSDGEPVIQLRRAS